MSVFSQKDHSLIEKIKVKEETKQYVTSVVMNQKYIFAGLQHGKIYVYNRNDFSLKIVLEQHKSYVLGMFHLDGILASVSSSPCSTLCLWDTENNFSLVNSVKLGNEGLRKVWLDHFKILALGRQGTLFVLDPKLHLLREIKVEDKSLRDVYIEDNFAHIASRSGFYSLEILEN